MSSFRALLTLKVPTILFFSENKLEFRIEYIRSNEYNESGNCLLLLEVDSMLNGYITTQEAAQKWNISARQVQILCKNNRIEGAVQINRIWLIPANVSKPTNTYKY